MHDFYYPLLLSIAVNVILLVLLIVSHNISTGWLNLVQEYKKVVRKQTDEIHELKAALNRRLD